MYPVDTRSPHQVYMAFVEVAPHNRGDEKKYERVAGCLIAFACRQSFIKGYLRKLFFDVKMKKYVSKQGVMKEHSHS